MSERENYRETPIAGTALILYSWTEGGDVSTRISWPPHGIERPIAVSLTLSEEEVDVLAAAFGQDDLPHDAAVLLASIVNAVVVQCAVLRKMQALDPCLRIVPAEVPL